jgi:tetratricopeptide (TPR) repeat protein
VRVRPLVWGAWVLLLAARLGAQAPQQPAQAAQQTPRPPDMQAIAAGLGVACEYCHVARGAAAVPAVTGKPRMDIAREMIAMTADLNARVQAATGKPAAEAVRVDCVTCHRGVAIPRQLSEIVQQAAVRQGPEAAVAIYRDLRGRYYGRQSYDFGEETLLSVADRLTQGRPAAALALADLNIEFFPRSARSYLVKGMVQSRQLDTRGAIASFKKTLELEPENGVAQGWLIQMEQLANRGR